MLLTVGTGPGHPATDIAHRLRNWLWYWQVKQSLGLSDDALDRRFLGEPANGTLGAQSRGANGARKRVFERIRNLGSDPTQPRLDLFNDSLFDRVHAHDESAELQRARQDFESPLWSMLVDVRWSTGDTAAIIEPLIASRGWYRATAADAAIAQFLFPDDLAFGRQYDAVDAAACAHLEANPCADHLALLAALYREAWQSARLDDAINYRDSLRTTLRHWLRQLSWHWSQDSSWRRRGVALRRLVDYRLIRDHWTQPDLPPTRSQRDYVRELLRAYSTIAMPDHLPRHRPIVQRSLRIAWLQANRSAAVAAAEELGTVEMVLRMLGLETLDTWSSRRRWSEYAEKVRRMLGPIPAADWQSCLPAPPTHLTAPPVAGNDRAVAEARAVPPSLVSTPSEQEEMLFRLSAD